jgi:hypothetical protein
MKTSRAKQNKIKSLLEIAIEGIDKLKPLNQYQIGMQDGIRLTLRIMRESERKQNA